MLLFDLVLAAGESDADNDVAASFCCATCFFDLLRPANVLSYSTFFPFLVRILLTTELDIGRNVIDQRVDSSWHLLVPICMGRQGGVIASKLFKSHKELEN